ncbi:ABC transporter ATP-binding protein [Psychrosphaera sp. B3R10]|uniref:ABC transporter ATP-binding protein n=1 Tax=unclassified Psychrosphaera TaxID=2641570 RepID=UPI001C088EE3|nr:MULTISPECIES: ABC transporter ATP-binding protein [unclassified Psychrosphaera]MBU2881882.1 ABC transporter ATP-binding protein [Psychrosphaera sp. I2R16]MBU2989903.1 ABC transporter ATP-binding protein [Psychrosphaera sp. B3R10]
MSIEIKVSELSHGFDDGSQSIKLLNNVNALFEAKKLTAITGMSGCGKSTLLTFLAGLDAPESGQIKYIDTSTNRRIYRRDLKKCMSLIFQQFHLLPELNTVQNIAFPLLLRGDKRAIDKAKFWLDKINLTAACNRPIHQLSGGEQQRVAIARAFVTEPKIIFADEPTGSLDSSTGAYIQALLYDFCKSVDTTTILVTHNEQLAKSADQQLTFIDRKLMQA